MLPTFLMEGPLVWPGQHAGFLGPRHDPWQVKQDPSRPGFGFDGLTLPQGLTLERLDRRKSLLDQLGPQVDRHGPPRGDKEKDPYADQVDRAYSLLLSGRVARAFDLGQEDPGLRDRYGRHMYGQSLLLARRLVEVGVPIVQVNMGRVQTWDTHSANFKSLKDRLLPPTDRGVATLLDDLSARGLLDETLVIVTGEFGRTPRIGKSTGNVNSKDGRDHWAAVFSAAFAGGGVRGGQMIGQSDKIGAYPASRPYRPGDLAATVYRSLGIDPDTELRDRLNRPIRLSHGEPISPLFDGASVDRLKAGIARFPSHTRTRRPPMSTPGPDAGPPSIVRRMRSLLPEAMKARDPLRTNFLRYWIAQLTLGTGAEMSDADAIKKMRGVLKEARSGVTTFTADEVALIREWVPATLTPEQISERLAPQADQIKAAPKEGMAMGIAMKTLSGEPVESDDVKAAVTAIRQ